MTSYVYKVKVSYTEKDTSIIEYYTSLRKAMACGWVKGLRTSPCVQVDNFSRCKGVTGVIFSYKSVSGYVHITVNKIKPN